MLKLKIALITVVISQSFAINSFNTNKPSSEVKIKQLMNDYRIPGIAVAVYKNGKMQKYLYGYSNLKSKTPVTEDTIFELGSITKTFTALLLAQQIIDKKIDWNAKLTTMDGDSNIQNTSLFELVTHTSGFPYNAPNLSYNSADSNKNQMELKSFLQHYHPLVTPQTKYYYSNIGFSLLAQELANRQNKTIAQLMQENILTPLNLEHTFLTVNKLAFNNYATGYTATGLLARTPNAGMIPGSWAMKSNLHDMMIYLKANLDEGTDIRMKNSMRIMHTGYFELPSGNSIGMGWIIKPFNVDTVAKSFDKREQMNVYKIKSPKYNANAIIEKTGSTDGFRAYMAFIPSKKLGVVILANKFTPNREALIKLGHSILLD